MSKTKTEILALIDRSGSMSLIINEAVGAFNTFIEEQRNSKVDDKVKVTLASFDDRYDTVYDRVKLEDVPELVVDDVQPRGMTALNDAIGKLITSAKYPERNTIVLIQTDGAENASKEFSGQAIKELVEEKEKAGWEFVFIGAGLNEAEVQSMAELRGIKDYVAVASTAEGMDNFKDKISMSTTAYRVSKI